ncbi:MAG: DUF420 domain-containing protein [Nitrospirae bacterium]|nr:DUF420 domain-containing protein [Nitrospirota bacterium]
MKELLAQEGFLARYSTLGADLSFLLSILFTVLFLKAWSWAKKHKGNSHHWLILAAMVTMVSYFVFYYLTRRLGVLAIEGREGFGGPDWVYYFIFSPILTLHIFAVSIGLVMAFYMITLGFRAAFITNGRRVLRGGELKIGKKGFLIVSLGGLALFLIIALIRCNTIRCASIYISFYITLLVVIGIEKIIERFLLDGSRRHRLIGRFTMLLYLTALITTTSTYLLLYTIYPPSIPK